MIPEYTFWSFNTQSSGRISPSISFRICFSLAQTSTCGWIHHNNSSVMPWLDLLYMDSPCSQLSEFGSRLFLKIKINFSYINAHWQLPPGAFASFSGEGLRWKSIRIWITDKFMNTVAVELYTKCVLSRQIKSWEIWRKRIGVKAAVKHGVYVMRVRVHQLYK